MILVIFLLIGSSSIVAQTILEEDLDYFVGAFAVEDSSGTSIIDCSTFADWLIIHPDTAGVRSFNDIKYSPNRFWVYNWQSMPGQIGEVKWHHRPQYRDTVRTTYLYYIMQDYNGHESQNNVLTIWEKIGYDSVRFVCGQSGTFYTGIGHARIVLMAVFPDGSLLLVADLSGEGMGVYGFYRGYGPCDFKLFDHCTWEIGDESATKRERVTLDFFDLTQTIKSNFRVLEQRQFLTSTYDYQSGNGEQISCDSVKFRTFDLWRLAKDHFGIQSAE